MALLKSNRVRPEPDRRIIEKAAEMYAKSYTMDEISGSFGISKSTIRNCAEKMGIAFVRGNKER